MVDHESRKAEFHVKMGKCRAALVMLALVVLAGCSVGGLSGAGGGQSTSPESTSAEPSPAGSESPTEAEPTPTVAPATGKVIKVDQLQARAPEGWITSIRLPVQQSAFQAAVVGTMIRVFHFPNSGQFTIDELGDSDLQDYGPKRTRKRLDDMVLDGQLTYHLVGREDGAYQERFGSIVNDKQVFIEFFFGNGERREERDEIIQSVLATVQFG